MAYTDTIFQWWVMPPFLIICSLVGLYYIYVKQSISNLVYGRTLAGIYALVLVNLVFTMSQQSFWSTGISSNGIRYVVTLGVYSFYCLVFLTLLLELQLLKQIIHLSNWYSKSFASAIQTGFCVFHLILLPSYWLFAEYASKNQWNADVHPWAVAAVSIYFGALFVWQHIQSFVLFRWIGQHLSTERKGNDPIRQQSYEHLVSLRWSSISLLPADWACLILAIVYRDTSMALSAEIAMLHCVRLLFWMNGLAHLESDTFFVPARRL